MTIDSGISDRKADHIELCATGDVGFHAKTTLLEHVDLVHDSLPELALDEIDTSVALLGKKLRAPPIISAMTGGTARARDINKVLASIAEERGYGFGLGSQRAMLRGTATTRTQVRDVAPTTLLLGNIGAVQARELSTDAVADLDRPRGRGRALHPPEPRAGDRAGRAAIATSPARSAPWSGSPRSSPCR